jgi:hypothetical protein
MAKQKVKEEEKIEKIPGLSPSLSQKEATNLKNTIQTSAEIAKAHLDAQTKVRIMIPLDIGERIGTKHPVTINGYRMWFPKGEMIDVPEDVATLISERFRIQMTGKEIDRDPGVRGALD